MVDLAEVIELVKSAFKKLPMKEKDVDAVVCLHDLQGEIAIIPEALAADNGTVL